MDRDYNEVMDDLGEVAEEELVVTTAGVLLEREVDSYYNYDNDVETELVEVYAARVQIDGKVHGVINFDSMESALDRAAELVVGEEEKEAMVSVRHIEALKATVDELGFDRAIALMERLNS